METEVYIDSARVATTTVKGEADFHLEKVPVYKCPFLEIKKDGYYGFVEMQFDTLYMKRRNTYLVESSSKGLLRKYTIVFLLDSAFKPMYGAAPVSYVIDSSSPSQQPHATRDSFHIDNRYFCDRGSQEFSGTVAMQYLLRNKNSDYQIAIQPSYRVFPFDHFYIGPLVGVFLQSNLDMYFWGVLAGVASNWGTYVGFVDAGYERIVGKFAPYYRDWEQPNGFLIPVNAGIKLLFNKNFAANFQISYFHLQANVRSPTLLVQEGDVITLGIGFSALLY